ncbi:hypothetical protein VMCG_06131 [Cytospora schulzeri]|uniref:Uncharacterized protein n=1 Tax=Cytospora schulzeri TaxID=448051 RepID=A0A423WGP6_9PEZI|nr:hypothetical protein VMCG_06131 [Valsa malicola]
MATRSFKGVFNSILLQNNTISSLRGFTQRRPFIVTIANHKNASRLVSVQTRNLHEDLYAPVASSKTPAPSSFRNHQWEGVRLIHNHPCSRSCGRGRGENKTDKPTITTTTTTTTTPNPQGAVTPTPTAPDTNADTDASKASKPTPDDKTCTCPACRWFPFHCHGAVVPKLLSDKVRDKLLQLADDLVRYTPVSEGPSTPPFDLVLRQRLEGHRRYSEQPPPSSSPGKDQGEGSGPAEGEQGRQGSGGEDKGEDKVEDEGQDEMGRSGYDTTNMGAGNKARPAAKGVEKKQKQEVKKKGDDIPNDDDNNQNGKTNGPAPLEKKERTIDDVRFLPGSGWTFWL